jgi:hypothetical protein
MNTIFKAIYKKTSPIGDSKSVSLGFCPGSELCKTNPISFPLLKILTRLRRKNMQNEPNLNQPATRDEKMQNEPNLKTLMCLKAPKRTQSKPASRDEQHKLRKFYPKLFSIFASKRCKKARTFTQKYQKNAYFFQLIFYFSHHVCVSRLTCSAQTAHFQHKNT